MRKKPLYAMTALTLCSLGGGVLGWSVCQDEDCRYLAAELLQANYVPDGQGTVVRTSNDQGAVILGDYSPPF